MGLNDGANGGISAKDVNPSLSISDKFTIY